MRITKLTTLRADGGWRPFSFLKVDTDEGLVGWSEFLDESFALNAESVSVWRFGNIEPGDNARFAGGNDRAHGCARRNGCVGRQVAGAAKVFCKRQTHDRIEDDAGKRRNGLGHE